MAHSSAAPASADFLLLQREALHIALGVADEVINRLFHFEQSICKPINQENLMPCTYQWSRPLRSTADRLIFLGALVITINTGCSTAPTVTEITDTSEVGGRGGAFDRGGSELESEGPGMDRGEVRPRAVPSPTPSPVPGFGRISAWSEDLEDYYLARSGYSEFMYAPQSTVYNAITTFHAEEEGELMVLVPSYTSENSAHAILEHVAYDLQDAPDAPETVTVRANTDAPAMATRRLD